jgi:2'-5' RNA ligase
MHVTVKFAGELPTDAVEPLGAELAPLAASYSGPPAYPLRLDAFPNAHHGRVVVLELVDASGALAELAAAIDERFAAYGVPREERPFRPHVTLARLKRPCDARHWLGLTSDPGSSHAGDATTARITALTLYRSVLGANGSSYVALARHALA